MLKDFIKKEKQDNDKRFYNITLKEAGKNFLKDFIPFYKEKYENFLSNFNADELNYLKELSLKIFSNLDSF